MDKTLQEAKKNMIEEMGVRIVRERLINLHPFTAGILLRLALVPVWDVRCQTACTDGRSIYIDIDFWKSLTSDEQVFLLAHETWHTIMLHFLRKESRDPELWNCATDMEINNLLKTDGFKVIKDCLLPPDEWKGLSAEKIYDKLIEKANQNQKNNNNSSSNGENKGNQSDPSYGNNGNGSKSFDKHIYTDATSGSENGEENSGNGKDKNKNGSGKRADGMPEKGFDPDFHPAPQKNASEGLAEEIRSAIIEEAQKVERTAGSIPSHIQNILGKYIKPEMPWKSILAQFVTQCFSSSRRWYPVNRRHVWHDCYMQSRRDEKLEIAIAVDTSGSCSEDLAKFYSEVTGLIKSFGKYRVTLIECDCQIAFAEQYSDDENPFPRFEEIKWHGGGGTSFKPVFDYIEENAVNPQVMVFFTDGYDYGEKLKDPGYPVLWILTKDGNRNFCDFGRKTYFKK